VSPAKRARKRALDRARYLERKEAQALATGMPVRGRKLVELVSQTTSTTDYDRLYKSQFGLALPYQTRMRISK